MKYIRKASLAFLVLNLATGLFAWKQNLEKNGVLIETRAVSGSAYKEFRATMNARTTMAKVVAAMNDIPGYARWMQDCKEARRLETISETSGLVYSVQNAPWPIADREAVVAYKFERTKKPDALIVSIIAEPEALPQTPGKVRIQKLSGLWTFTQIDAEYVRVEYRLHSEPGGYLPSWAIAGMISHLPYQTLVKLRSRLEE